MRTRAAVTPTFHLLPRNAELEDTAAVNDEDEETATAAWLEAERGVATPEGGVASCAIATVPELATPVRPVSVSRLRRFRSALNSVAA